VESTTTQEFTMNLTPSHQQLSQKDIRQLLREVEHYLAAVDAFRSEGCEPAWQADPPFPLRA
jgi:hypothetical protein